MKRLLAIFLLVLTVFSLPALGADWNKPQLTDTYTNFLNYLSGRLNDAARWLDSAGTSPTNTPHGAKRWNAGSVRFEVYSGASPTWRPLATTYMIDVDKVDGADAGTGANNILKLDGGALVPLANIPATLTGKSADLLDNYNTNTGTTAGTIPVRDVGGKLPGDVTGNAATAYGKAESALSVSYATTAGNSSTVGGYAPNTGTTASTIPVRDSSGKLPGDITGNAATASASVSTFGTAAGMQVFTGNGTFVVPANVTKVFVRAIGGGGGGGGGSRGSYGGGDGGGGGGGGGYSEAVLTVTPGQSYAVSVGGGGAAGVCPGTPGNGTAGGSGGVTSFGALLSANGGAGGAGGAGAGGGAGGAGGSGTGTLQFAGTTGGNGVVDGGGTENPTIGAGGSGGNAGLWGDKGRGSAGGSGTTNGSPGTAGIMIIYW